MKLEKLVDKENQMIQAQEEFKGKLNNWVPEEYSKNCSPKKIRIIGGKGKL